MIKSYLIGLAVVVLVTTALVSGWFSRPANLLMSLKSESCDLNDSVCQASTSDLIMQLDFNPKPVPILKPITITAALSGFTIPPAKIQLVLEGVNMYMGFQKAWLEQQEGSSQYVGTLLIPSCEITDMQWKVTLLLPSGSPVERAEFYMQTHHE